MSVQAPTVATSLREYNREGLPVLGMIVTAQFSVSGFAKRWSHCNQLANYFARFASANAPDPERMSTLLSTFFNEVLEVLFRNQSGEGQIQLTFRKESRRLALRAEVPVHEESLRFYRRAAELANQPNLEAWYLGWLENSPGEAAPGEDNEAARAVGLLELVAVYDSTLTIEERGDGVPLLLNVEFPFDQDEVE